MAALGAGNQLARRVIDDLVDFSAFDDPGEVFDTLMGLRDDKRVEETELIGLNELITQAEEEVEMKEAQELLVMFNARSFVDVRRMTELCVFNQARKEEASFAALMRELCCSLRMSLSKKRRLAELEGLEEQRDAVKALENIKEIVDSMTLGDLEQLLARTQVGVCLKDGYLANVEDKA
ncbi:hypothetical protein Tco_0111426 [Tanacetum coccineum]